MQRLIKRLSSKPSSGVPTGDATAAVASNGTALPQPQPRIPQSPSLQQQQQQQQHQQPTPQLSQQQQEQPQEQQQQQQRGAGPSSTPSPEPLEGDEVFNEKLQPDDDQEDKAVVPTTTNIILPGGLQSDWEAEDHSNERDDDNDADSAIGSDTMSSTASLTSTILNYRTLHGRRYHSEMNNLQYWAANDEQQSEVMDLNHHNLTIALGDQLYIAPLERDKIKKVLDVGTGTGIWAIDFADEFPDAEIIGTDISPIQPSWVPPNLQFEIEDCSQEWTFGAETFDFIHMRWLVGGIADWYDLFAQAYRTLQPGGWVQSLETSPHLTSDDGSVTATSAMGQWGKFFIEGGNKLGRPFTIVDEGVQRKAMEAAGFVDIQEYDFKMPLGSWPKDPRLKQMGQFAEIVLDKDIEGWVLFMANTLGWSREEILVYVGMLRKELRSGALHAYYSQKVVWARKPEF